MSKVLSMLSFLSNLFHRDSASACCPSDLACHSIPFTHPIADSRDLNSCYGMLHQETKLAPLFPAASALYGGVPTPAIFVLYELGSHPGFFLRHLLNII